MGNPIIAAYSGGALPAAIGILRISGDGALELLQRVFTPSKSNTNSNFNQMIYGKLLATDGQPLDFCLACKYKAPASYTGEDMAEIFCHGSEAIVTSALRHMYALGARPAEAGEFTKRAFLAGKLSLAQVEAVGELIYSRTEEGAKNAASQLTGRQSRELMELRQSIMDILSHFYAVCDYSDEDIEPFEYQKAVTVLQGAENRLDRLYQGYLGASALTDGLPVALIGRPNTGKSSLFNALAGFDRAIVTDEAGTTRDVIDHRVSLGGTAIRLFDTAGIRRAQGKAEAMGVEKTLSTALDAHALICVFDGSGLLTEEDFEAIAHAEGRRAIAVINKSDLPTAIEAEPLKRSFERVITLSAKTGQGIEALAAWLEGLAPPRTETLITGERQGALVGAARDCLRAAIASAHGGMTADAFLLDAEQAARLIGQVVGIDVSPDISAGIFARFCVGK